MIEIMKTEQKLQKGGWVVEGRGGGGGGGGGVGGMLHFVNKNNKKTPSRLFRKRKSIPVFRGTAYIYKIMNEGCSSGTSVPYLLIEQDPLLHPAPPTQY